MRFDHHLLRSFLLIPKQFQLNKRAFQFKIVHRNYSKMSEAGYSLVQVVEKLNEFASEGLAESWDNVGLLYEPHTKRYDY